MGVSNGRDDPLTTSSVVVNLYYGPDQVPAGAIMQPGAEPFPPVIAPQDDGTGVFVFTVPEEQRDEVLVEVDVQFDEPVVLFAGSLK